VVVVAGDIERVAAGHLARDAREAVPDGFALAVFEGGAFDLRRGGGNAPPGPAPTGPTSAPAGARP